MERNRARGDAKYLLSLSLGMTLAEAAVKHKAARARVARMVGFRETKISAACAPKELRRERADTRCGDGRTGGVARAECMRGSGKGQ